MASAALRRQSLSISAAAALLVGCGGSQPPIGAPGAMRQSRATATHAQRGGSWMLPEAKRNDLLYVSAYRNHVSIYSYTSGKLVGQLRISNQVESLCSDKNGNIWVPVFNGTYYSSKVLEFAHGGRKPIAVVDDGGALPAGCSVNPVTGDLAIVNYCKNSNGGTCTSSGDVVVFAHGTGSPKTYTSRHMGENFSGDYDSKGDLFVVGNARYGPFNLAELPFGESKLKDISIQRGLIYTPSFVCWDGQDVAISSYAQGAIYRFAIHGTKGQELGSTSLNDTNYVEQFILHGKTLVVPGLDSNNVAFYDYPAGGSAKRSIAVNSPLGVALSLAAAK